MLRNFDKFKLSLPPTKISQHFHQHLLDLPPFLAKNSGKIEIALNFTPFNFLLEMIFPIPICIKIGDHLPDLSRPVQLTNSFTLLSQK